MGMGWSRPSRSPRVRITPPKKLSAVALVGGSLPVTGVVWAALITKVADEFVKREVSVLWCGMGRKNYLFVGNETAGANVAGANVAGLYALAATCEARGINPMEYFTDIIGRVGDHPVSRLDELLPGAWAEAQA